MEQRSITAYRQGGLSMAAFLFVIIIVGLVAVLAMKVGPTVVEFMAIKNALVTAKNAGKNAKEIQDAFDRQRTTAYIDSVTGKDLEIIRTADGFEVGIAYQKKIELVGPASLVIDYVASTDKSAPAKKPQQ